MITSPELEVGVSATVSCSTAAGKGHRRKVIVIGFDPHKSSHTAAALATHTHGLVDRLRIDATLAE